jgi:hypothetical protein
MELQDEYDVDNDVNIEEDIEKDIEEDIEKDIDEDIEKDIEEDNTINGSWIKHFDTLEGDYDAFYKEDIEEIQLAFMYVDTDNCLVKLKKEVYDLPNLNVVTKGDILNILINNRKEGGITYKITSIYKYNISLNSLCIMDFIKSPMDYCYLTPVSCVEEIVFDPTIHFFNDLTTLYFVLKSTEIDEDYVNDTGEVEVDDDYDYANSIPVYNKSDIDTEGDDTEGDVKREIERNTSEVVNVNEKPKKRNNKTKKVYITTHNNSKTRRRFI